MNETVKSASSQPVKLRQEKEKTIMSISRDRLKELENLPDSEIDTSDIPELDETFWQNARKVEPVSKETVAISLDKDTLNWLKHETSDYQNLINQVLRAYMNQH
nr:BrnA antitoxin family protein [Dactylococcopsis salina]